MNEDELIAEQEQVEDVTEYVDEETAGTLSDLVLGMVDENVIYVLGAFVIAWAAGIGLAQFLRPFIPNTKLWVLKVRAIAAGFTTLVCGLLLSLVVVESTAWTQFVVITVFSATCGLFAPLVYDPIWKQFLWPRMLRPVLLFFVNRVTGAPPPPPPRRRKSDRDEHAEEAEEPTRG